MKFWPSRRERLVNLAENSKMSGVSGLPPVDDFGQAVDAPLQEAEPTGFLSRVKGALAGAKGVVNIATARDQAEQALSLVSPWLTNIQFTVSQAFIVLARKAYGGNPLVYSCVRLLSASIAEPPLVPYKVATGANKEELDFSDPLYRIIRNPNELMTTYDFVELSVTHMTMVGRCHWWKERDNLGRVIALWPLRPDRVGPLYAVQDVSIYGQNFQGGTLDPIASTNRVLAGWNYWPPGSSRQIRIPRADVITMTLPNPAGETGGMVEGLGPIQVLAREIESDNEATSFVAALLKNSAMPGAILHVKASLIKDKVAAFKREWKRSFGGDRRGDVAIFDGDTVYQEVGFNMQQLEFPHLRNVSESRVAAATGIPSALVGFVLGTQSAGRSTLAEYREFFAETTCPGWWQRIQEALTRDLASEFGLGLLIEFDTSKVKALILQSNRQIQPFQLAFQAGAVTVDEYRMNVLGLGPLPEGVGNVLYVPSLVNVVNTNVLDQYSVNSLLGTDVEDSGNTGSGKPVQTDDNQSNADKPQVKPSQEHDNDPRAEPGRAVRPKQGPPSAQFNTKPGTSGKATPVDDPRKIIRIEEVRKHLGQRGKAWIPPIEWRSPQYIYDEEKVS